MKKTTQLQLPLLKNKYFRILEKEFQDAKIKEAARGFELPSDTLFQNLEDIGYKIMKAFIGECLELEQDELQRTGAELSEKEAETLRDEMVTEIIEPIYIKMKSENSMLGLISDDIEEGFSESLEDRKKEMIIEVDIETKVLQEKQSGRAKSGREKQQKFKILDAINQLKDDMRRASGIFGRAVLFLDLDNFKALNSQFTEVWVDKHILPAVHETLRRCADGVGFAYAAGGDEFVFFLPNCTHEMGLVFAHAVRSAITELHFGEPAQDVRLTASVGFAHGQVGSIPEPSLYERSNLAKKQAKEAGKNCVYEWLIDRAVLREQ